MKDKLAVVLMFKLLDVIRESGANRTERAAPKTLASASPSTESTYPSV